MKAPAFRYQRVNTIAEALEAYSAAPGEAAYLAGGQSLIPSLALRLQAPSVLIDLAHVAAMQGVALVGDRLRIGALTRHAEMLDNPLIRQHAPLLSLAAPHVAHPAIRNRGTIGGSVALADPAAEFPTVLLALRANFTIAGPLGERTVAADDFFQDLFVTALHPGEILTAMDVPIARPNHRFGFDERAMRRGDYGLAGCAVALAFDTGGLVTEAGIAFLSTGPKPMRAVSVEATLTGAPLDEAAIRRAQSVLDQDIDPSGDDRTPAATRRHLARVLLGRTLSSLRGQP